MNYSIFFKLKIPAKWAGFTLVELIVVMAISTIIMTTLVIQQRTWDDRLALNTQTYEVALMIRQAQIFALGVREYTGEYGTNDKFDVVYGVYFNTSDSELNKYTFFVDKNRNYLLDTGEEIETKTLTRGITVEKLCGLQSGGQEKCSPTSGIRKVSVTFYRPEPKATVKFINPADNTQDNIYPPTKIFLKSANSNKEAYIKVETNGQVSIVQ